MKQPVLSFLTDLLFALGLGVLFWIFFGISYRHHLHYQEQLQLFLLTPGYFTELISRPGGLAIFLGRFVTQSFYHTSLGAALLSTLLAVLYLLVRNIAFHISRRPAFRLLACLPSFLFALLLCDENVQVNGLIATILATAAVAGWLHLSPGRSRQTLLLACIPLLYWLLGMAYIIFVILSLFIEWKRKDKETHTHLYLLSASSVLFAIGCPLVAKWLMPQFPLARHLLAGEYYRFVNHFDPAILYVLVATAFIPILFRWLPGTGRPQTGRWIGIVQVIFLVALTGWGLTYVANWTKEELMGYDYYTRTQRWNNIIAQANRKAPNHPMTVSMLNLALGKKDYLPEYIFYYYQNGAEGLIPSYSADYLISLLTGEVYYHLGLVNSAQRYAFEGMETIPDHQKSVRSIKRLAETNLINGQYTLAAKYLHLLQHTIYYKDWANETLACLGNEDKINTHPEWGQLRANRLRNDSVFAVESNEPLLRSAIQQNPANRMASQYLLALYLLKKELPQFASQYAEANNNPPFDSIPKSYREALAYIRMKDNPTASDEKTGTHTSQALSNYLQIYSTSAQPEATLRQRYGNTYWYYLNFRGQ